MGRCVLTPVSSTTGLTVNRLFDMSLALSPAKDSTLVSVRGRFDSPLVPLFLAFLNQQLL